MTIFTPPVKNVVRWGWQFAPVTLATFWKTVDQSGQGFDGNGLPACQIVPNASCDISIYQHWGLKSHGGEDVPCPHREPILNSADGRVLEVNTDRNTGLGVVVFHPQHNLKTIHWHMDSIDVKVGDEVKQGQVLGLADSTGASTGTHDHWACKATDNLGNTINKDNGWLGNIPFRHLVGWFKDMRFVKVGQNGVEVYLVVNSQRSKISNALAFQLMSGNWSSIEVITQAELDLIPSTGKELLGWEQE